jgi:hypothetical protein
VELIVLDIDKLLVNPGLSLGIAGISILILYGTLVTDLDKAA